MIALLQCQNPYDNRRLTSPIQTARPPSSGCDCLIIDFKSVILQ